MVPHLGSYASLRKSSRYAIVAPCRTQFERLVTFVWNSGLWSGWEPLSKVTGWQLWLRRHVGRWAMSNEQAGAREKGATLRIEAWTNDLGPAGSRRYRSVWGDGG